MVKIALAQTEIIWENKEENFRIAQEYIMRASKNDVDLILFPEMSFTGFTMNTQYSAENDGYTCYAMKKIAQKYKIHIGFGWVKEGKEKAENHYTILDIYGNILSDYVKIHPFSYSNEDCYFCGGDKLSHFCIDGIPFSTFICYDLRFPEVFQIASQDAHFIIIPANWPKRRREHWNTLLRARAIENQVYIIAINCIGENIGGLEYSGDSCVINPNGDVVMKAEGEGLWICDIYDDVEKYRSDFPVKQDRRIELYHHLAQ